MSALITEPDRNTVLDKQPLGTIVTMRPDQHTTHLSEATS